MSFFRRIGERLRPQPNETQTFLDEGKIFPDELISILSKLNELSAKSGPTGSDETDKLHSYIQDQIKDIEGLNNPD